MSLRTAGASPTVETVMLRADMPKPSGDGAFRRLQTVATAR